jgi:SAM-dependent methyltransferase
VLVSARDENAPTTAARPEPSTGETITGLCPHCGPGALRILPFRYAYLGRHIRGAECLKCSLVSLQPMLTDDEIAGMYSEEYFTECTETCGAHGRHAYMELAEETAEERRRGALRLDRTLAHYLPGRGALGEIGCGPGFFLAEMRQLGWSVRGLEISAFAAQHAREKLGLDVTVGAIGTGSLAPKAFDAIFLGDVLEHLPRPLEALGEIHQALRPGGVVAVAVPSTLNLLSGKLGLSLYRGLGRVKTLRIPPYHLVEYTPPTLRRMLASAGFAVLELRQSTVPIRRMGLRGSPLENSGKVALQLLAQATSSIFNRGGDRLLAVGRRVEPEAS